MRAADERGVWLNGTFDGQVNTQQPRPPQPNSIANYSVQAIVCLGKALAAKSTLLFPRFPRNYHGHYHYHFSDAGSRSLLVTVDDAKGSVVNRAPSFTVAVTIAVAVTIRELWAQVPRFPLASCRRDTVRVFPHRALDNAVDLVTALHRQLEHRLEGNTHATADQHAVRGEGRRVSTTAL